MQQPCETRKIYKTFTDTWCKKGNACIRSEPHRRGGENVVVLILRAENIDQDGNFPCIHEIPDDVDGVCRSYRHITVWRHIHI